MERCEYPEKVNVAYKLFARTSRHFGENIIRGGRQTFRSECSHGGRTSVIFTQEIVIGNRGGSSSKPGSKLPQVDPVPGRDV